MYVKKVLLLKRHTECLNRTDLCEKEMMRGRDMQMGVMALYRLVHACHVRNVVIAKSRQRIIEVQNSWWSEVYIQACARKEKCQLYRMRVILIGKVPE